MNISYVCARGCPYVVQNHGFNYFGWLPGGVQGLGPLLGQLASQGLGIGARESCSSGAPLGPRAVLLGLMIPQLYLWKEGHGHWGGVLRTAVCMQCLLCMWPTQA